MIMFALLALYVAAYLVLDEWRVRRARSLPPKWDAPRVVTGTTSSDSRPAGGFLAAFLAVKFAFLVGGSRNGLGVLGVLLVVPVVRRITRALGLPRVTYAIVRAFHVGHPEDSIGFAVLEGARALLHAKRRSADDIAWLEERLLHVRASTNRQLTGVSVVAAATLCVARHDLDGARALFRSAVKGIRRGTADDVVADARTWLMADAAEHGAWRDVVTLDEYSGSSTQSRLLGAIARRMVHATDAPSDFKLRLRWLAAPYPHRTLPMVKRALAAVPVTTETVRATEIPSVSAEHPLANALAAHAALLEHATLDEARVTQIARTWDAAFSNPKTGKHATERSHALGVVGAEAALKSLRTAVEHDLAMAVRRHKVRISDDGTSSILAGAARALRDEVLQELEAAVDTLDRRTQEKRALPPLDEWREFLAVQRAYAGAAELGGDVTRRVAFTQLHNRACGWAVWLFNERKEKNMANACFAWLLEEAIAVGDVEAETLQRKNVSC